MKLDALAKCVVCNSHFAVKIGKVDTIITKNHLDLYTCLDCNSYFNPSGYVPDDSAHDTELKFHIKVEERNTGRAHDLLNKFTQNKYNFKKILEIGCGTGTLLNVAKSFNYKAVGFDINKQAIEYGKDRFNLDLRDELWDSSNPENFDLLACIMVLEHIEKPRELFAELAEGCKKNQALLFVSVPFISRGQWKFLYNTSPSEAGTPFFNNDVHVTHFSKWGLVEMAHQMGLIACEWLQSPSWTGFMMSFDEVSKQKIKNDMTDFYLLGCTKNISLKEINLLTKSKNKVYSLLKNKLNKLSPLNRI